MRKHSQLFCAIVIFLFVFVCLCVLQDKDVARSDANATLINVTKGESVAHLARELKQKGLISNEKLMRALLALSGTDRQLKVGSYKISKGSIFAVAKQFQKVKPQSFAVCIIPGKSLSEAARDALNKEKLLKALSQTQNFPVELQAVLPKDAASRIIFILPETYFLVPNDSLEEQLVKIASRLWYERVGKNISRERFNAKSLLECGIMASIVEGEARVKEDRPILAAIFYKRLGLSMRLQSCATVMYCWKEFRGVKKTRLLYKDLNIDSPFNTYKHDGLPPQPINFPSLDSWCAVLNCGQTDYLYFVADGKGKHLFSKSYKEHLARQKGLR